jgi:hypothetical protein
MLLLSINLLLCLKVIYKVDKPSFIALACQKHPLFLKTAYIYFLKVFIYTIKLH